MGSCLITLCRAVMCLDIWFAKRLIGLCIRMEFFWFNMYYMGFRFALAKRSEDILSTVNGEGHIGPCFERFSHGQQFWSCEHQYMVCEFEFWYHGYLIFALRLWREGYLECWLGCCAEISNSPLLWFEFHVQPIISHGMSFSVWWLMKCVT